MFISPHSHFFCKSQYLSPRLSENVANFIFVTNNAYPVKVELSDRRYCVLDCSGRYKGVNEYFDNLEKTKRNPDFYPTLMTYFSKYNVEGFVPERIPQTQARINLIKASLTLTDRWICKNYDQLCLCMAEDLIDATRPRTTKKFTKFQKSSFVLELRDKCTYDKATRMYKLRPEMQRLYLPYKRVKQPTLNLDSE